MSTFNYGTWTPERGVLGFEYLDSDNPDGLESSPIGGRIAQELDEKIEAQRAKYREVNQTADRLYIEAIDAPSPLQFRLIGERFQNVDLARDQAFRKLHELEVLRDTMRAGR